MIREYQILRNDTGILLGIALDNAVLDILTNDDQLQSCLKLLQEPHRGSVCTKMGTFGIYPVTLSLIHDDSVCIGVDGPYFEPTRSQFAAIYLEKEDLRRLLVEAVQSAMSPE